MEVPTIYSGAREVNAHHEPRSITAIYFDNNQNSYNKVSAFSYLDCWSEMQCTIRPVDTVGVVTHDTAVMQSFRISSFHIQTMIISEDLLIHRITKSSFIKRSRGYHQHQKSDSHQMQLPEIRQPIRNMHRSRISILILTLHIVFQLMLDRRHRRHWRQRPSPLPMLLLSPSHRRCRTSVAVVV